MPGVQKSGWAGCHDRILQSTLAVRHVPGSRAEMLESPGNPASCPVTPLPGPPTRHGSDISVQAAIRYISVGCVGWVLTVGRQEGKSRGGQTGISALWK